MSTTAQEQGQQTSLSTPPQTAASAPANPPAQAQAKDNSRDYVLFEEARQDTWTQIGTVKADSQEAALESLGEQKLKGQSRFMAIPARFVRPVKPKVTTVTTVSFE